MDVEARESDMTKIPLLNCKRISLFSIELGPGGKEVKG